MIKKLSVILFLFLFNTFLYPAAEQKDQSGDYCISVDNGVIYEDNGQLYIVYPLYDKTKSIIDYKKIILPDYAVLFEQLFNVKKYIGLNENNFDNNIIFNIGKNVADDKAFNESSKNLRIYDIISKYTKYDFYTLNKLNELISTYKDQDRITLDTLQYKELKIKLMITIEKKPVYDKDNKEFWISNTLDLEISKNDKLIKSINLGSYADVMFFFINQNKLYLCFNVYKTDMFYSTLAVWELGGM